MCLDNLFSNFVLFKKFRQIVTTATDFRIRVDVVRLIQNIIINVLGTRQFGSIIKQNLVPRSNRIECVEMLMFAN